MIVRARLVLPMLAPPIEDGAIVVTADKIAAIGPIAELKKRFATDEIVDMGDHILLPGLINAHCHLDYTMLRGEMESPSSFAAWVEEIVARKRSFTSNDYVAAIRDGLAEAQNFGTTSVVSFPAYVEAIQSLTVEGIRVWWCPELIDVQGPVVLEDMVRRAREILEKRSSLERLGLAPHAPYTVSSQLYQEAEQVARRHGFLLSTHIAESAQEMELFRERTGPLFDLINRLSPNGWSSRARTPLQRVTRSTFLDKSWLVAHLNELSEGDLAALEPYFGFSVVHCPRSHRYFGHTAFPYQELKKRQINICLGTDSVASAPDLNLFAEVREFCNRHPNVPLDEVLHMVTLNPGKVLMPGCNLGSLVENAPADAIAVPWHASHRSWEDTIREFDGHCAWRMIAGQVFA